MTSAVVLFHIYTRQSEALSIVRWQGLFPAVRLAQFTLIFLAVITLLSFILMWFNTFSGTFSQSLESDIH